MSSENKIAIDTHTHLYDSAFINDRADVLVEARSVGVYCVFSVSENLENAKLNLKLTEFHPEVLPAAGLYPANVDLEQAEQMEGFINKHYKKLVGIGEVGLDYWVVKKKSDREIQKEIFRNFINLSLRLNLPLNVHSRSAGHYAIDLLLKKNAEKVQLHAFDGKASSAMPAVEAGYYFSIPPSIVRSKQKQKLVKKIPISSILLESDCPALGPDPDKRNVPANIMQTVDIIAEIKNISRKEVLTTVLNNTKSLYGHTDVYKKLEFQEFEF